MFKQTICRDFKHGRPHHAYFIFGGFGLWPKLKEAIADIISAPAENHPDVSFEEISRFGIKHSVRLRAQQQTGPILASRRFFTFQIETMTLEAQNALLKTLEEPAKTSCFFFLFPRRIAVLPTLCSRAAVIDLALAVEKGSPEATETKNFLGLSAEKRLAWVEKLLVNKELASQHEQAGLFLDQVEREIYEKQLFTGGGEWSSFGEQIDRLRKDLASQASLPRLVLEHFALTIPGGLKLK